MKSICTSICYIGIQPIYFKYLEYFLRFLKYVRFRFYYAFFFIRIFKNIIYHNI